MRAVYAFSTSNLCHPAHGIDVESGLRLGLATGAEAEARGNGGGARGHGEAQVSTASDKDPCKDLLQLLSCVAHGYELVLRSRVNDG